MRALIAHGEAPRSLEPHAYLLITFLASGFGLAAGGWPRTTGVMRKIQKTRLRGCGGMARWDLDLDATGRSLEHDVQMHQYVPHCMAYSATSLGSDWTR